MSFDKPTRNKLASMVGGCRRLLNEDIRHQNQAAYGLQPDGDALAVNALGHLDERGREAAEELRAWQAHLASTEIDTEQQRKKEAFNRVARETAFTALNRLAALRMCEERGHVIECVRRGMESDGFLLYERFSSGVLGDRGQTYRIFLERMFDELAVDLGALFDRRAPQSLVFPRERCLEEVLALLNAPNLAHLWKEDETIGWIYQYFNSKEEREAMRKFAAPRNSRELAVRNQFFTPRYVVEFLVDNTLGRTWYEMRHGNTALIETCQYLVRRPTEIFLSEGEEAPTQCASEGAGKEALSQEDLLKQPVYIVYRAEKDPRDLKILDPACGSGHFLLYCFDLLETIYEEAWAQDGPPASNVTGGSLHHDYPELARLKRDIPELIIRHNLHGIDIDLRACQIAALVLWLRAQKSYQRLELKPAERPGITRSNIVCAEPMPGEPEMLEQFVADLRPNVIGQLVRVIFEKMKLAGEAGSLLKIEEEIRDAVAEARKQWLAGPKPEQQLLFGESARPQQVELAFDFSGITDAFVWERAEDLIYKALERYAEQAANGHSYQRRLFADDARRGFGFIDLCRKRYDVVLMNPPFGSGSGTLQHYLERSDRVTWTELFTAMVSRGLGFSPGGLIGAITSRTCLTLTRLTEWRERDLVCTGELIVDLGLGVMDNAFVEACAYTSRPRNAFPLLLTRDLHNRDSREISLLAEFWKREGETHVLSRQTVRELPEQRILLGVPHHILQLLKSERRFEPNIGTVRRGFVLFDGFRFVRLSWEVAAPQIGERKVWVWYSKGGEYQRHYGAVHMLALRANDGEEMCAINESKNGQTAQAMQGSKYYFRAGVTYTSRSQRGFAARCLPAGCITSDSPAVLSESGVSNLLITGWLNSRICRLLIELQASFHKYEPGHVKELPWPASIEDSQRIEIEALSLENILLTRALCDWDETDQNFYPQFEGESVSSIVDAWNETFREKSAKIASNQRRVSEMFDSIYGCRSKDTFDSLGEIEGDDVVAIPIRDRMDVTVGLVNWSIGVAFGRWEARPVAEIKLGANSRDPFAALPTCPPGMLQNEHRLPLTQDDLKRIRVAGNWDYPLDIPWDGILVDDPENANDIVRRLREVLSINWKKRDEEIEQEVCQILEVKNLGEYFRKPSLFFADHLKRYSKSRRQAPIYWPLSTASGSYTLWIYYHRLNDGTLYTALNEFVKPKIDATEKQIGRLESDLPSQGGREASKLREAIEQKRQLLEELHEFRDELERVTALPYKPNLNDGVLIAAAPLWKLFRLPKWRKDLQECWKNLEAGDYDWAHLAYSIWPDRVREVCKHDRSIAIAHGLEELCEVVVKPAKKKRSKKAVNIAAPIEPLEETVPGDEE